MPPHVPTPSLPPIFRFRPTRWLLFWLLFIVYGSFVPLDLTPVAPDQAWQRFVQAPMLQLGVASRADWIANGLLYFPLGLLAAWGLGRATLRPGPGRLVSVWLLAMLLALVVEFLQVYFPPRTVSRNDLVAEALGAAAGVLTAWAGSGAWQRLGLQLRQGQALWSLLGGAYLLVLLLLALFPFDLLISAGEWVAKLQGGHVGLWLASSTQERSVALQLSKLLAEVLVVMPVGLWLAARRRGCSPAAAVLFGALLGLLLELAQLPIASGVSQGASVLTRAVGVAVGAWLLQLLVRRTLLDWRAKLRSAAPWLLLAYLPLMALAQGWAQLPQADLTLAEARWQALRLLPFYYHYFTTETVALVSLLVTMLAYAPIGVLGWAFQAPRGWAPGLAAILALCSEALRLVLPGTHPDPTNVLIGAASAALVRGLLEIVQSVPGALSTAAASAVQVVPAIAVRQDLAAPAVAPKSPAAQIDLPPLGAVPAWRWAVVAGVLALVGVALSRYPWQPQSLALGLAAAAALVAWRPALMFVLVPLALPVLDLAPFSGRRFFDELDLLILLCAAVAWARLPPGAARAPKAGVVRWALAAVGLALLVGTARAMWPWPGVAPDAFDQPMSAFNALRVAKGGLWALLLWCLGRRLQARGADVGLAFGWGMCAGLAATVLWVLAERMAFSHLLDFRSDYRISGPFSDMSLNSAYVECFITCALPFVLQRMLPPAGWRQQLPGLVLVAGASYALMVTYSRGGQAAGALAVLLMVLLQVVGGRQRLRRLAVGLLTLCLAAVVAVPVLQGAFAQQRLATVDADIGIRERHWADSLALVDNSVAANLLGMGLGRYAELRLWHSPPGKQTASHRLIDTAETGRVLRLSSGYAYFVEQVVRIEAGATLQLRLQVRQASVGGQAGAKPPALAASLCQKWIIASFDCSTARWQGQAGPGGWWALTASLHAPAAGPGRLPRPLRLSLHNAGPVALDVTSVSLRGMDGSELLHNGDFTAGMDRWTFTSDDHLAWHAKSLLVGAYVELGLLGAAAMLALLLAGAGTAMSRLARGWPEAAPLLAALAAFACIGLIDTLVDVPRFLLLFMLLCTVPALGPAAGMLPAAGPQRGLRR